MHLGKHLSIFMTSQTVRIFVTLLTGGERPGESHQQELEVAALELTNLVNTDSLRVSISFPKASPLAAFMISLSMANTGSKDCCSNHESSSCTRRSQDSKYTC